MSKKLKIFVDTLIILKNSKKLLTLLLFLLTFLMNEDYENIAFTAQPCSNLKFPLTFGFSLGETEIISIDQDSSTGYIYIAGTTTATELIIS